MTEKELHGYLLEKMPSNNKLVFRNSGLLKLPVEVIYQGGNSKARNPKIQNMLRMIGFGENVGSVSLKLSPHGMRPTGVNLN